MTNILEIKIKKLIAEISTIPQAQKKERPRS